MVTKGASQTDPFGPSLDQYGVLKEVGVSDKYIDLAQAIAGKPREFDPALASFLYFSKMGELASQPGATLFGSVAGAASSPAEYLMKLDEENRKIQATVPATAINLMKALKPSGAGTTTLKTWKLNKDIPGIGQKGDEVTLTNANAAMLVNKDPASLTEVTKSTSTGKASEYGVSDENLVLVNEKLGSNLIKSPQGNILLTSEQFSKVQDLVTQKGVEKKGTSMYERLRDVTTEIGLRIKNNEEVSAEEKSLYSTNFQKLTAGFKDTRIENGVEKTVFVPGIDLLASGLPAPEGLDVDKIISQRNQNFDQSQTQDAGFGSRMLYNEGVFRNVLADGYILTLQDIAGIRARSVLGLGNIGADPKAIQFHIAAQNWVAAQLRKESGAAIAPSEYADALEQYFPKAGDSREVILQKQALREEVTRGMINSAGDAFAVIYPTAQKYLTYTSGGETYEILDPQGYALELGRKTQLGATLQFKEMIESKTLEELKDMLANPNAVNLYSDEFIDIIEERIKFFKEQQQAG